MDTWLKMASRYYFNLQEHACFWVLCCYSNWLTENAFVCDAAEGVCGGESGERGGKSVGLTRYLRGGGRDQRRPNWAVCVCARVLCVCTRVCYVCAGLKVEGEKGRSQTHTHWEHSEATNCVWLLLVSYISNTASSWRLNLALNKWYCMNTKNNSWSMKQQPCSILHTILSS